MSSLHKIHSAELAGGITVLGEEIPHLASAAFTILIGAGAATDPQQLPGASSLLSELMQKGAGDYDCRKLSEEFESYGAHRSQSSGIEVSTISCAQLGEHLHDSLSLYGTMLAEPWFPQSELASVQALALQDLAALEDEPSSKVMHELANRFYPAPFNRSQLGTKEGIESATAENLRAYYETVYADSPLVIGVAGSFDWDKLLATVSQAFAGRKGGSKRIEVGPLPTQSASYHEQRDTKQVQIALAYPSVPLDHPLYYVGKVAVSVLSGGMAGRLFIEVREKRGLVYRVSASQSAARGRSAIFASAGTTPENAEETLAVMCNELRNVAENLDEDELQRAKADLKSKVIMRGESSFVRSASLVNDWWNLNQIRSLDELRAGIDAVSIADIEQYAKSYPVEPITLMSLGPKALELPQ